MRTSYVLPFGDLSEGQCLDFVLVKRKCEKSSMHSKRSSNASMKNYTKGGEDKGTDRLILYGTSLCKLKVAPSLGGATPGEPSCDIKIRRLEFLSLYFIILSPLLGIIIKIKSLDFKGRKLLS
jgi:hypothetical protein